MGATAFPGLTDTAGLGAVAAGLGGNAPGLDAVCPGLGDDAPGLGANSWGLGDNPSGLLSGLENSSGLYSSGLGESSGPPQQFSMHAKLPAQSSA